MRNRLVGRGLQAANSCFDYLGCPVHELLGYGVSRFEFEDFFGVTPDRSRRLAWASAANCCKNWNVQRVVRRFGLPGLAELLDWKNSPEDLSSWQAQKQAVLLVSWHCGPMYSVAAGLARLGLEGVFCVGPPPPFSVPDGLTFAPTMGGGLDRTEALHQTLQNLRQGGTSYIVADHPTYSTTRATLFGREVSFSPSISMLAKVSSAKVVPIAASWGKAGRIIINHGRPLEAADSDELLTLLAQWFESHLSEHPQDIEPKYLMKLLFSPTG